MHRCTPTRDAWLKSATYLGILRKSIQRSWPDSPTRKGCRTILLLPGDAFQRLWQGGPPRKHTRTRLLLQGNEFQRLRPGGSPRRGLPRKGNRSFQSSGQGVPQERLQNKILITRKCLPEALARGSPQERLQNKILITRKSSRARFSLPGNACRGSGHGVPQEGHQKKIVFTRRCVPEALAGDPAQEKLQNKIAITWKCLPEAWPGSPPRNGSRTRSFLPGNAFQRLWPRCPPPGKALELDRYYQEVPSRGSGQRVLVRRELHGTQGRARTKALRSRQNENALGGPPWGSQGPLVLFTSLLARPWAPWNSLL
jgi:hypothetical protein